MLKHTVLAMLLATTPALADINIYSTRQPDLIDPILEAFTEETGIAVNTAFIDGGLIERLEAEGTRSPADLVLTVDIANLSAIANAGLTQSLESDTVNANIPAEFRDPDGLWIGLTSRARIVYASKDRVDPSEVTSYEDLADPKWADRICIRSGLHNYNIALLSSVIAHHGAEAAEEWLTGIKANLARKPQGNDRAQVKAIWAGECDIAIGNTYYMGKMLADPEQAEWANSVNVLFPVIGGEGAHVNLSGVALTANAPNKDEAIQLIEYLTSDAAQALYAELNYEYPLNEAVSPSELVQSWGSFTADSMPLTEIAKHRGEAIRIVERVNFDE